MNVAPEEGIERFLAMAKAIFETPRKALDALRAEVQQAGTQVEARMQGLEESSPGAESSKSTRWSP